MKVHSSHSSYTAPLLNQSSTDSDDDTPFVLPDDDDSSQKTTAPSISTTSVANSISSGFWLNQSGSTSTDAATPAAGTDGTDSSDDDSSTGDLSNDDILSEFAKWANMSPADKIRSQYLEQQNLTEQQFAQLPSDQQKAINDQIADEIKQQLGGKTGSGASDDDSDGGSAAVSLG